MGFVDVGPDETGRRRDGRAHRRAVQGPHPKERDIVFNGPAVKKHILYKPKKGDDFAELDFTYFNAVYTVENALAKAKDEKGLKRVARFLEEKTCPDCGGTRLSEARAPHGCAD